MSTSRLLLAPFCLLAWGGGVAAKDNNRVLPPSVADAILKDAPLTITFQQADERPLDGVPHQWCWSINSVGQGELTVETAPEIATLTAAKTSRRRFELPEKEMAAIRKVLREERFFHFKGAYGPVVLHGGWSTLTVVAGEHVKQVRFFSAASWASPRQRERLAEEASAARVWLKVCETVDPDEKVFTERQRVAKALGASKQ